MTPPLPSGAETPSSSALGLVPAAAVAEDHRELLSLIARVILVLYDPDGLAENDLAELFAFLDSLSLTQARTLACFLATAHTSRPQGGRASSPASSPPSPMSGMAAAFSTSASSASSGVTCHPGSSPGLDQAMAGAGCAGVAAALHDASAAGRRAVDTDGIVSGVPIAAEPFTTTHADDRDTGGAGAAGVLTPTGVMTASTTSADSPAGAFAFGAEDELVRPPADTLGGFEDIVHGPGGDGSSPEIARLLLQLFDQEGSDFEGHDAAFDDFDHTPYGDGPDRPKGRAAAQDGREPVCQPADDAPPAPPASWIDDHG